MLVSLGASVDYAYRAISLLIYNHKVLFGIKYTYNCERENRATIIGQQQSIINFPQIQCAHKTKKNKKKNQIKKK